MSRIILVLCFAVLLISPGFEVQAFTSSNFSIHSYSIGAEGGGVVNSTSYIKAYNTGSVLNYGAVDILASDSGSNTGTRVAQEEESVVQIVDRGGLMDANTPMSFISEDYVTGKPVYEKQEELLLVSKSLASVGESGGMEELGGKKSGEGLKLPMMSVDNTSSGIANQVSSKSRFMVVLFVFLILFYVRLYTDMGRRLLPF